MPESNTIEVRILRADESCVLAKVAPGVFDKPIDHRWATEFFADTRHHLAVAIDAMQVVGMASALHYIHPDKPPELWINEIGVAPTHRKRGLAKQLLAALLSMGHELGCTNAWVLTDRDNAAAMRLYAAAGGAEQATPSIMFQFRLDPQ